jgi:hypothetical protein
MSTTWSSKAIRKRKKKPSKSFHSSFRHGQTSGASDPVWMFNTNVTGTLNVLEAARAVGSTVVYVSTATLYGQHADLHPLTEEALPESVRMYNTTKLIGRNAGRQLPQDLWPGYGRTPPVTGAVCAMASIACSHTTRSKASRSRISPEMSAGQVTQLDSWLRRRRRLLGEISLIQALLNGPCSLD